MNAELKTSLPTNARFECSMGGDSQDKVVHKPMPPLEPTRIKRLKTSDEIACALHLASPPANRTLQGMVVVLGALVTVCIFLAAIVWWRLLT